ncbi:MAG: hypothetical protein QG674_215 [Patescibacteria group bacterium]|jgi:hypothetical protein|nr:hypothetical protein [Patescibacteria group bacterium]
MKKTLIIILLIGFLFFCFRNKLSFRSIGGLNYAKYSTATVCINSGKSLSIKDPSDPLVLNVKALFLNKTKISEEYFNQHFSLDCAGYPGNGAHVLFRYKIGDYSTAIRIIKLNGSGTFGIQDFHEITNVIPEQVAYRKLKECLNGNPTQVTVDVIGGLLYMRGNNGAITGQVNLENGECQATIGPTL